MRVLYSGRAIKVTDKARGGEECWGDIGTVSSTGTIAISEIQLGDRCRERRGYSEPKKDESIV